MKKSTPFWARPSFRRPNSWPARLRGLGTGGYSYGDIALLYRINAMSRVYEQKFLENRIPYRVVRERLSTRERKSGTFSPS